MTLLVTGGTGMVGQALRAIAPDATYISSKDCDLTNQEATIDLLQHHKPTRIIHLAARVGGVYANNEYIADFYRENILINTHVLHASYLANVSKVVSLLSTCIYPDQITYPLKTDNIHNGEPHESNFGYAYAKRMLDVQSRAYRKQYDCHFITAVPNNLFGKHDNFDLQNSHVIPAIIRKIFEAKQTGKPPVFWGDGSPLREFTFADDLADILLFLLDTYDEPFPINVGNTKEYSIKTIVSLVADILAYQGEIIWDSTALNGQLKKPSDNTRLIDLGWQSQRYTPLEQGLKETCQWFIQNHPDIRGITLN